MSPEKLSPWVTSIPGGRRRGDSDPDRRAQRRFWITQPLWFSVPTFVVALLLLPAAFMYTGWPPAVAGGWAILICAAALVVGLVLGALSGRVELQARGLVIKLIAGHRFVPFRQASSTRVLIEGSGRHQRSSVEVTLVSGERIKLRAVHADSACRAIYAAVEEWERSCDDAEQQATEPPRDEHGPYRSQAGS